MTQRLNNLPTQTEIDELLRIAMSRHLFLGEALYVVSGYRTTQDKDDVCFPIFAAGQSLLWQHSGAGGCPGMPPPIWHKVPNLQIGRPYRVSDRRNAGMLYVRSIKLLNDHFIQQSNE